MFAARSPLRRSSQRRLRRRQSRSSRTIRRSRQADIQRLQDSVFQAGSDVQQLRSRDAARAAQLQSQLDDLRDEVIYLKVKLRKEGIAAADRVRRRSRPSSTTCGRRRPTTRRTTRPRPAATPPEMRRRRRRPAARPAHRPPRHLSRSQQRATRPRRRRRARRPDVTSKFRRVPSSTCA